MLNSSSPSCCTVAGKFVSNGFTRSTRKPDGFACFSAATSFKPRASSLAFSNAASTRAISSGPTFLRDSVRVDNCAALSLALASTVAAALRVFTGLAGSRLAQIKSNNSGSSELRPPGTAASASSRASGEAFESRAARSRAAESSPWPALGAGKVLAVATACRTTAESSAANIGDSAVNQAAGVSFKPACAIARSAASRPSFPTVPSLRVLASNS